TRSYFVKEFSNALISGFDDIAQPGMNKAAVEAMTETVPEFYERRNRFLDHLLARFGEQFTEYALLLTGIAGKPVAQQRLIDDKISFLKRYPLISHDRAKAFNYTLQPSQGNEPGIKKRIGLLLGYPDLTFIWTTAPHSGGNYSVDFRLIDGNGRPWVNGSLT